MDNPFRNQSKRRARIEHLAEQLERLLDKDFPAAYDNNENRTAAVQKIKDEELLIKAGLSALRLLQAEHRLANYLITSIFSGASLVVGAFVGYLIKQYLN
jgi:aryl carrier-like protein